MNQNPLDKERANLNSLVRNRAPIREVDKPRVNVSAGIEEVKRRSDSSTDQPRG